MANEQNLIPMNKRTKSEQREIARKGGKKSGEVRRARKTFKEDLILALETVINNKTVQEIGIEEIMKKYMAGDLSVFTLIRDTIGEKPTENVKVDGNIINTNPLEGLSTEEIRKAIEMMNKGE